MSLNYHEIKYSFHVDETFSIMATADINVSGRPFGTGYSYLICDLDIRFILDCKVVDLPAKYLSNIRSHLRSVCVNGLILGKKVSLDEREKIHAEGFRISILEKLKRAIGEEFNVIKSFYGPIVKTEGGKYIKDACLGMDVEEILSWYGASFPQKVHDGQVWNYGFMLKPHARSLGLPIKKRVQHPINVHCEYRSNGFQESYPKISQKVNLKGVSKWGPLKLSSVGKGTGLVLPDMDKGKISRSQKDVKIRSKISTRLFSIPFASINVNLKTDSWHI